MFEKFMPNFLAVDNNYGSIIFCMGVQVRQNTRHCSLRSLVAKGAFSGVHHFALWRKNDARPLKVLLATSERSEQCRVSGQKCPYLT
jgi:hypothetical protein